MRIQGTTRKLVLPPCMILFYWLYCDELVVLIKSNFEVAEYTVVGNKLSDCTGGKSNNPVVVGARNYLLSAALIISEVFFSRNG